MIGQVARNRRGQLAVISWSWVRIHTHETVYTGIGFDGTSWESTHPTILATSLDEYIREKIEV